MPCVEGSGPPYLVFYDRALDRLLHVGPHCKKLKQHSRPRIEHLRRLTGREWGLQEQQLRVVANGYVRGSLEHAAAAWLPATPPTHVEVLERELRAAARVVTGCTRSTPVLALMAEAGIIPMSARRTSLAARLLTKARARSEEDPLRQVADAEVRSRLSSVRGALEKSAFKRWGVLAADDWSPVAAGVRRHRPRKAKRTSSALYSPVRGPTVGWNESPSHHHGLGSSLHHLTIPPWSSGVLVSPGCDTPPAGWVPRSQRGPGPLSD